MADRAQNPVRRTLAAVALCGVALIHLLDLPGQLKETFYLGVLFIALIIAALLAAELLARRGTPLRWAAAGTVAASPLIGYVLSRTTGLPDSNGDIGNWLEPLGLASLFVEGTLVLLVILAFTEPDTGTGS
ncbi:MAG: hypothetical protein JWN00_6000 [Actinomycetia bacterium]|nr:hypothetical protein [Actinomycetes bacterium]